MAAWQPHMESVHYSCYWFLLFNAGRLRFEVIIQRNSLSLLLETISRATGWAAMSQRVSARNRQRPVRRTMVQERDFPWKTEGPSGRNGALKGREIRGMTTRTNSYERVRVALKQDALPMFQSATKAAAPGRIGRR